MKNKLIEHYVNLYRAYHSSNEGLLTTDLNRLTIPALKKRIAILKWLLAN